MYVAQIVKAFTISISSFTIRSTIFVSMTCREGLFFPAWSGEGSPRFLQFCAGLKNSHGEARK